MKAKIYMHKSILIIVCIASSSLISSCGVNTRGWKDLVTTGFNLNETDIPLSIDIHAKDARKRYSDEDECDINLSNEQSIELAWNQIIRLSYNPKKMSNNISDFNEWYTFTLNYNDASFNFTVYWKSYNNTLIVINEKKYEANAWSFWDILAFDLKSLDLVSK
mgnify:CR=1 FL=1